MLSALVSVVMAGTMALTGTGWKVTHLQHKPVNLVNCEDYDVQPCITFDDGKWRKVDSYNPYRAKVVKACKSAKGGPSYPCVVTKPVKGKFRYFK